MKPTRTAHEHGTDDSERMVTAVLVCTSRERAEQAYDLPKLINEEPEAQAIFPSEVITRLFEELWETYNWCSWCWRSW